MRTKGTGDYGFTPAKPGCLPTTPRSTMPTVIGHHDISKGKDRGLSSPKREDLFCPLGVTNIRTFVNPENPTQVAVLMEAPTMDALRAPMQTGGVGEGRALN